MEGPAKSRWKPTGWSVSLVRYGRRAIWAVGGVLTSGLLCFGKTGLGGVGGVGGLASLARCGGLGVSSVCPDRLMCSVRV